MPCPCQAARPVGSNDRSPAPIATRDRTRARSARLAESYRAHGLWQDRTLIELIREIATAQPLTVALVDGDVRLTYSELIEHADTLGKGLRRLGIEADERVVIQLPNRWEHVVATLACLSAGLVPVWALPEHRHRETVGLVRSTQAAAIVTVAWHRDTDLEAQAWQVAAELPIREVVVVGEPRHCLSRSFVDVIGLGAMPGPTDQTAGRRVGDDVAILIPSGGTTGMAKVAPRTNNELAYMISRATEICEFSSTTVYLAVLPLGHGFPNTGPGVLGTLMRGGRVVLAPSPNPEAVFALVDAERATATSVVPAISGRWVEHARTTGRSASSLRLIQVGAARLDEHAAREIEDTMGCRLQQVYGMSEGLLCLTRLDDGARVYATQGRPISDWDEVRIVDDDGHAVPPGVAGSLITRGPYTICGYFDGDRLQASAFTPTGWYRTGDQALVTEDGYVVIAGREKDLINRGGEKISAEELEELCRRIGVGDCAAVAMPDPVLGEEVCLFVTGDAATRFPVEVLRAHLRSLGLAEFKAPKAIVTLDAVPTTGIGKIDKKRLRAHFQPTPAAREAIARTPAVLNPEGSYR